jgi:hypothetical protein
MKTKTGSVLYLVRTVVACLLFFVGSLGAFASCTVMMQSNPDEDPYYETSADAEWRKISSLGLLASAIVCGLAVIVAPKELRNL